MPQIKRPILVTRSEANFDRACDEATRRLASVLEIDDCGHPADNRFDRQNCSITLKFVSFELHTGMGGSTYVYIFEASLTQDDDAPQDEAPA